MESKDSWEIWREGNVLHVVFRGHVGDEHGDAHMKKLHELMGDDHVHIVAHFMEATIPNSELRKRWQKVLFPRRRQFLSLMLASDRAIMRMAVSAFALVLGIECHCFKSEAEVNARVKLLVNAA